MRIFFFLQGRVLINFRRRESFCYTAAVYYTGSKGIYNRFGDLMSHNDARDNEALCASYVYTRLLYSAKRKNLLAFVCGIYSRRVSRISVTHRARGKFRDIYVIFDKLFAAVFLFSVES